MKGNVFTLFFLLVIAAFAMDGVNAAPATDKAASNQKALNKEALGTSVDVKDIRYISSTDHSRVIIDLSEKSDFEQKRLFNPDRLSLTIKRGTIAANISQDITVTYGHLKSIKTSRLDDAVRVMLEFNETIKTDTYQVYALNESATIVADFYGADKITKPASTLKENPRVSADKGATVNQARKDASVEKSVVPSRSFSRDSRMVSGNYRARNPISSSVSEKTVLKDTEKEKQKQIIDIARNGPDEEYLGLGFDHMKNNNYQDAAKAFENALRVNPENADAYAGLGICYLRLGDTDVFTNKELVEKSVLFSQKALQFGADYPEIHFTLGMSYTALGNIDAAVDEFDSLMRTDDELALQLLTRLFKHKEFPTFIHLRTKGSDSGKEKAADKKDTAQKKDEKPDKKTAKRRKELRFGIHDMLQ